MVGYVVQCHADILERPLTDIPSQATLEAYPDPRSSGPSHTTTMLSPILIFLQTLFPSRLNLYHTRRFERGLHGGDGTGLYHTVQYLIGACNDGWLVLRRRRGFKTRDEHLRTVERSSGRICTSQVGIRLCRNSAHFPLLCPVKMLG
jgi:hypothetical protein